ncbi:hypothetical protein [Aeromonas eucrenophila]|uniref:Stability determinant n=1 Tax=Aeromonas eucrenophila TaxID=649 RepID=A0ABW0Y6W0_9GAMM|nr:hypothetical protein [Aeromonas eucrenophila]
MEPAENTDAINQAQQDERWIRHTMALAARAEGDTGEIPVGTAPMFKAHRQYKEVRA